MTPWSPEDASQFLSASVTHRLYALFAVGVAIGPRRPAAHVCVAAAGSGRPARVVMDVLGHSQLAITTDLYTHVLSTALREAAEAIDRALGQDG